MLVAIVNCQMICWMHRWQIGATAAGGNICHQPCVRQTRRQLRRCHVGIWIRWWWHMMRQIVVSRCRTDCNGSEVEPVATLWISLWEGFNMERQFINRFISMDDEVMYVGWGGYSEVIDVWRCRVHSKLLKAFVDRPLSFFVTLGGQRCPFWTNKRAI